VVPAAADIQAVVVAGAEVVDGETIAETEDEIVISTLETGHSFATRGAESAIETGGIETGMDAIVSEAEDRPHKEEAALRWVETFGMRGIRRWESMLNGLGEDRETGRCLQGLQTRTRHSPPLPSEEVASLEVVEAEVVVIGIEAVDEEDSTRTEIDIASEAAPRTAYGDAISAMNAIATAIWTPIGQHGISETIGTGVTGT